MIINKAECRNETVWECLVTHNGRQIDKWRHYFDIYEKHFARFVGKSPRVMEIGVDHGGSLQLWKSYFGPGAEILGVDINPECAAYVEEQIMVATYDQKDARLAQAGMFDIIIDDGSHLLHDQRTAFNHLWSKCRGVYLIEDINDTQIYATTSMAPESVGFYYPHVAVVERAQRIIKGKPSRKLRADEIAARTLYGEVPL